MTCNLAPSLLLNRILKLATLQALALLWLSALSWPLAGILSALVIAVFVLERNRLGHSAGQLSTKERRWFWTGEDGCRREFEFCGELLLWRWLIVINGRDMTGRRLRLVLARDAADIDEWRRLQVALRYSRAN